MRRSGVRSPSRPLSGSITYGRSSSLPFFFCDKLETNISGIGDALHRPPLRLVGRVRVAGARDRTASSRLTVAGLLGAPRLVLDPRRSFLNFSTSIGVICEKVLPAK